VGTWKAILAQVADELGVAGYNGGPLEVGFERAPRICLELIDDGRVLVAHADLGALDLASDEADERLFEMLVANAPQYIEADAVTAIDSVTGGRMLFRRFEDDSIGYGELADELRQFAEAARRKLAERPSHGVSADAPVPFSGLRV
jgi:hypothetical protein